jgi:hypothetical protein
LAALFYFVNGVIMYIVGYRDFGTTQYSFDGDFMRFFTQQGWGRALLLVAVAAVGTRTAQAQPQNYYTGTGGKGIRIAVLEPVGKGLSDDEQWMLSLVQHWGRCVCQ